ncbi:butyrophilin subfamily 1 member A1 isoform X3 [Salmo salar]|uniref:Butyrophilin subfamily 1 member A1-like isoform X2 n=1 Tax=Salmo salar TaxID=8030 RepID=A0ABM3E017_SALSA|nr:butyrophilin subfamily 1 member A1-like isoform X2 [Salmo salar]XP_045564396.1 butyrophilin subfamily 1 member A1-like isoform X3 [Salmo salar]
MMTGTGCWCGTLLLLLHIADSERFEVLGSTRAIVAVAGDDIILPCYIKPNISAEDMRVDWFRINLPDPQSNIRVHLYQDGIDKYHDQVLSYRGRTSLFKEELKKGNTSLKLTRVQGTDDGRYKCLVESKTHYDDATIQVYVRAVGSKPEVSIEGQKEGGMALLCVSKGWFPEPELEWLDSEGVTLSAGPSETDRDYEGFYIVKLKIPVNETDNLFTCRLRQRQQHEVIKMETEFHFPSEPILVHTDTWKVALAVIGSLGFFLMVILAFTIWRWNALCKVYDASRAEHSQELEQVKDELRLELEKNLNTKLKMLADQLDLVNMKGCPELETIRKHAVDVTLDPDTAHPKLILSEDRKQVRRGAIKQDLPDNAERFNTVHYVLGKEGFSSGRFYYEVQVNVGWTLGVVRESIDRKKMIDLRPDNGCWTVWLRNGKYEAFTVPPIPLYLKEKPQKVGVFVDYEEGQVSFYNVEARSRIFSFTGYTFTEKLCPLFCCGTIDNSAPLVITPVGVTD